MEIGVIIPAAGSGKRFGGSVKKQYLLLKDIPIFVRTIQAFARESQIKAVVVVVSDVDFEAIQETLYEFGLLQGVLLVKGGQERYDSVQNGLKALPNTVTHVLIHDGARPLLTQALVKRCIAALSVHDGFTTAIPSKDTVKRVEGDQVIETLNRSELVLVQTPQGFNRQMLMECYKKMDFSQETITDDASLFENFNLPVAVILGEECNIKVTNPMDLIIGNAILDERGEKA